jgi:NADH:ubiquinone oxidoreductase subunit 4 (subunit M)
VNLAVVLVATYVAIGVWALLLNELNVWASTVNQFAPYLLFLAIVLIAAAMEWVGRHRERAARSEHD